jgi:hypothetical protein
MAREHSRCQGHQTGYRAAFGVKGHEQLVSPGPALDVESRQCWTELRPQSERGGRMHENMYEAEMGGGHRDMVRILLFTRT